MEKLKILFVIERKIKIELFFEEIPEAKLERESKSRKKHFPCVASLYTRKKRTKLRQLRVYFVIIGQSRQRVPPIIHIFSTTCAFSRHI